MRGRRGDASRAAAMAIALALPIIGACQLLAGIEKISYSADATTGNPTSPDAPNGPVTRDGPPCSTGEGGVCVPAGAHRDGKFCSGGRLLNCGRTGDPCCPGGNGIEGAFPDFCTDGNSRCEADGGYCVEGAVVEDCGEVGKACCSIFQGRVIPCDLNTGCCDWPSNKCVAFDTPCSQGLCKRDLGPFSCGCGGAEQPCCSNDTCIEPGTACVAGKCARCGLGADMPCCPTPAGPRCNPLSGTTCGPNGTCLACGTLDAGCCIGSTCNEGACDTKIAKCTEGASCGGCGAPGEACCGGACSAGSCCDPDRNKCVKQGDKCANGWACGSDLQCACGTVGRECCANQKCEGTSVICSGGECVYCGSQNTVCCAGNQCNGTRTCDGGTCPLVCDAGTCQ